MSDTPQTNEADVEVKAVAALIRYLEPLSEEARIRVLDWAQARFVRPPITSIDVEPFTKMIREVAEVSTQLDPPMSPRDFLAAATEIARVRAGLAPTLDGEEPRAGEACAPSGGDV